jgi:hypothetical protein
MRDHLLLSLPHRQFILRGSFYDSTLTSTASFWKADLMKPAGSCISPSGISSECRSTFAG